MERETDELVSQRLLSHGYVLPAPAPPIGLYEPYRLDRGTGYLAGQMPWQNGEYAWCGRVGSELTPEQGRRAAVITALNVLAGVQRALGGFERLRGLLRVDGYVASSSDFVEQPYVLDAASEILLLALGERGKHARTAHAPERMPKNTSVKLVATFAYDE